MIIGLRMKRIMKLRRFYFVISCSVKVLNLKFKKDGTCNPVLFQYTHTFGTNSNKEFSIKEVVERSEDYITVW